MLHDADLFGADEAFLTSTTREVVPIVQVDDTTIGSGTPGPITRALLDAIAQGARADRQSVHHFVTTNLTAVEHAFGD